MMPTASPGASTAAAPSRTRPISSASRDWSTAVMVGPPVNYLEQAIRIIIKDCDQLPLILLGPVGAGTEAVRMSAEMEPRSLVRAPRVPPRRVRPVALIHASVLTMEGERLLPDHTV